MRRAPVAEKLIIFSLPGCWTFQSSTRGLLTTTSATLTRKTRVVGVVGFSLVLIETVFSCGPTRSPSVNTTRTFPRSPDAIFVADGVAVVQSQLVFTPTIVTRAGVVLVNWNSTTASLSPAVAEISRIVV